jgi:pimeloyl-ACP methyl ester carboxylesterase
MEFLEVGGGRIHYEVTGAKPPVVLSHGIGRG